MDTGNCSRSIIAPGENLTRADIWSRLVEEESDEAVYKIPTFLILSLLVVFGIPGNALVLVVYQSRFPASTTKSFILAMATFDLLNCMLGMPFEMVDLRYDYQLNIPALCKIFRFFVTFSACGSVLVLVAVALDRFRRLCRPFRKQMTVPQSKMTIGVLTAVSTFLAIPALVLYGKQTEVRYGFELHDCSIDDVFHKTSLAAAYQILLGALWFLCIIGLSIMYGFIVFKIRAQKQRRLNMSTYHSSNSALPKIQISSADSEDMEFVGSKCVLAKETSKKRQKSDAQNRNSRQSSFKRLFSRDVNPIFEETDDATPNASSVSSCQEPDIQDVIPTGQDLNSPRNLSAIREQGTMKSEPYIQSPQPERKPQFLRINSLPGDTLEDLEEAESSYPRLKRTSSVPSLVRAINVEDTNDIAFSENFYCVTESKEDMNADVRLEKFPRSTGENELHDGDDGVDAFSLDTECSLNRFDESAQKNSVWENSDTNRSNSLKPDFTGASNLTLERTVSNIDDKDRDLDAFSLDTECSLNRFEEPIQKTPVSKISDQNRSNNLKQDFTGASNLTLDRTISKIEQLNLSKTDFTDASNLTLNESYSGNRDRHPSNWSHDSRRENDVRTIPSSRNSQASVISRKSSDSEVSRNRHQQGKLHEFVRQDTEASQFSERLETLSSGSGDQGEKWTEQSRILPDVVTLDEEGMMSGRRQDQMPPDSRSRKLSSCKNGSYLSLCSNATNLTQKKKITREVKTSRVSMMMCMVTAGFVFSYLPHLCIQLARIMSPDRLAHLLCDHAFFVIYHLALRSIFFNHALNPIIYGFYNKAFRQHCLLLLSSPSRLFRQWKNKKGFATNASMDLASVDLSQH